MPGRKKKILCLTLLNCAKGSKHALEICAFGIKKPTLQLNTFRNDKSAIPSYTRTRYVKVCMVCTVLVQYACLINTKYKSNQIVQIIARQQQELQSITVVHKHEEPAVQKTPDNKRKCIVQNQMILLMSDLN